MDRSARVAAARACGANLMTTAEPAWRVTVIARGNITARPSLIVTSCGNHVWLTEGRVHWT